MSFTAVPSANLSLSPIRPSHDKLMLPFVPSWTLFKRSFSILVIATEGRLVAKSKIGKWRIMVLTNCLKTMILA